MRVSVSPSTCAFALIVFVLGLVVGSQDAGGYPVHRRWAASEYKQPVRCELCHGYGGGTERNAYAKDWQKRGETRAGLRAIEPLDSDADGASNKEEIVRGSNPGDARSTPEKPGRYARTAAQVFVPREQIALVLDDVDAIDVIEAELTAEQAAALQKATGAPVGESESMPTIYAGQRGGRRVGVAMFAQFDRPEGAYSLLVGVGADGKITRVALFRAGADEGSVFRDYLTCLQGRGKRDIPGPGEQGCPTMNGREAALASISGAVRTVLWTLSILFAKSG